jgi:hypothetical protein
MRHFLPFVTLALVLLVGLLIAHVQRLSRDLEELTDPEVRQALRWYAKDRAAFFEARVSIYKRKLDRDFTAAREAMLVEREEYLAKRLGEMYAQVLDQVDRGVINPRVQRPEGDEQGRWS